MTTKHGHPDRTKTVWAVVLIAAGVLFLIANLGGLAGVAGWFWAVAFVLGGGAFIAYAMSRRERWWGLIPGSALLGLAAAVVGGAVGGALFLALIGAGFGAVYALEHERWWAIIPAGTLLSLGAVAWTDALVPRVDGGWILFLGLAATFGLLYALPEQEGRQRWAIYPALATLAFALVMLASGAIAGIVVPMLLIAGGIFLLWRRAWSTGRDTRPTRKGA